MKAYKIRIDYGKCNKSKICIVENNAPLFSWSVAAKKNEKQVSYKLCVSRKDECIWDSNWVLSQEQSCRYQGKKLETGEVYQLKIWLKNEEEQVGYEESQLFCLGNLKAWNADWICEEKPKKDAVVSFIKDFKRKKTVESACLFVCGLGYHKVYLNGSAIYTNPMNPAFSEYDRRRYYTVLPGIEKYFQCEKNRIVIRIAAGWRGAEITGMLDRAESELDFRGITQMSAMLRIRYADGCVEWICTDESWEYCYGEIVSSSIYMGERCEASYIVKDFSNSKTKLTNLCKAAKAKCEEIQMSPQTMEDVCEQEEYRPRTIIEIEKGVWSIDFGQNIAGVCRLRIPANISAGQTIEIRHMDMLDENGRLYTAPLRNAASTDVYVAAGNGQDFTYWQPEFTYHGFRYAEISGFPDVLTKEDIVAVSQYMSINTENTFSCGNSLINQIYKNIVQTEKSNLHSILSDCPQRDERLGWLNDLTVRLEAAPYSFEVGRLFPKVVRDCRDVQTEDGSITDTAPFGWGNRPADPVCSSYLIAGWQAYIHTGNIDILKEGYEGFCRWNAYLEKSSKDYLINFSYYGDWAAPAYACAEDDSALSVVTPGELMSTGYFYYNSCLLEKMAKVLGLEHDADNHHKLAEKIKESFVRKWVDSKNGCVGTGSQACQAFALWLEILPLQERQKAADYLHKDLVNHEYKFTTGNLCTRYLMDVLTRYGYLEDAWKIATREEYPSLGFMIQNEATTIWERFELKKNPGMNSHNHPMYGAVAYWYFAYLAGIKPLDAGWKQFEFRPYIPEKLLYASAVKETPYGDISVKWAKRCGEIHLYLQVPYGAQARVILPWGKECIAGVGNHHWKMDETKINMCGGIKK